ncbi:PhoD-like phosphatase [Leptolyngbya sp. NK1-12]|nr:PhoD-like phosphatase [Leptolyngbya sp. NK1-12]
MPTEPMPWIPLQQRLHQLPLILAGPILRRTESTSVTVWLALRRACRVTLRIYATEYGNGLVIGSTVVTGERSTIALGKHLHVVAVTAQPDANQPLQSGQIYAYDLSFQADPDREPLTLQQALNTEHKPAVPISYFEHQLPTFLLPPQDINELKLIHGSCRKTHGGGIDALPIVDDLLEQSARFPQQRPHQLFFTGDQIYGDDVADPWLFALTDAGDTLLGWEEELPIYPTPNPTIPPLKAKHLPPGERTSVAENLAGFTAGLYNKPDHTNSHLLSLGEYSTAYLFAWSPVLWNEVPEGHERYRDAKRIRIWDQEVATLRAFWHSLWKVRRAIANIPTYMIFDDHDISDDWYLNQTWCLRVLGKPLGRRAVQNGLLAYAIAQAWGNTPEQFAPGTRGEQLLLAAQAWSVSQGTDQSAAATLARLLGIPDLDRSGQPKFRRDRQVWILDHHPDALQWHYTIRSDCHEVVVLDTRTWRGYPIAEDNTAPPMLLCPSAFDQQIRAPLQQSQAHNLQTLVIAPTNLIHLRIIDWAQQWSLRNGKVFSFDVGDAWNLHKEALSELLAALFETRDRVVVLSGDIHYGFAARLSYWTRHPEEKTKAQVLVQLTASAFKNAEFKTQIIQTKLKSIAPEPPQEWVGWNHTPELWELQSISGLVRWLKLRPVPPPLIRQLHPTSGNPIVNWTIAARDSHSLPDWHYRIEWIKRQSAHYPAWGKNLAWLKLGKFRKTGGSPLLAALRWLWCNRWLQEGEEVVGESNLGVVQFRDFTEQNPYPTVYQDLYWCPPWRPNSIVNSRFDAMLAPESAAMPFPLLPKSLRR